MKLNGQVADEAMLDMNEVLDLGRNGDKARPNLNEMVSLNTNHW